MFEKVPGITSRFRALPASRAGEREGIDYHFISADEFQPRLERGEFLENADVHGHYMRYFARRCGAC